ncbi:transposase [Streptomyces sp. 8N114]|uniref:transposase n=1 Tax=Streptomyces sp. 8N114 TaxID=3457419 RepID=UPI003FD37B61
MTDAQWARIEPLLPDRTPQRGGRWRDHREVIAIAYKQRNAVEQCINRLKRWRGLATRYEKTATIYLAGLHIAGIFLWSAR